MQPLDQTTNLSKAEKDAAILVDRAIANQARYIIDQTVTGKWTPCHDEHGHHYKHTETGKIVDSVTTINGWIAKHHLTFWAVGRAIEWLEKENRFERLATDERENIIVGAKKAHTDVRDDAGDVGSQAHDAIERYIIDWINTGHRPDDIRRFFNHDEGETVFGTYIKDLDITILADTRAVAAARAAERLMVDEDITPVASEIIVGDSRYSAGSLDFLCLNNGKLAIWDWKTSNSVDEYGYPLQVGAYKGFFEHMTGLVVQELVIMKLSKDTDTFEQWIVPDLDEAYSMFKTLASFYNGWIKKPKEERITKLRKSIKI